MFGDYVSVYDFAQSVADGATVPLFYESRQPELQLSQRDLRDELDALSTRPSSTRTQEEAAPARSSPGNTT